MKYFDYAATSLPDINEINNVLKQIPPEILFGNPSSLHEYGIVSKKLLEDARQHIAKTLKCSKNNIIFTSGGTEGDNMAILGIMSKYNPDKAEMITSTIEHPAVLNTCKRLEKLGYKVHYVKPDKLGIINIEDIKKEYNYKTKLISIMAVNNEIGTIQPIEDIWEFCKDNNIIFHSDMVQATCLPDLCEKLKCVHIASFSGHKFGAFKGTGFVYIKPHVKINELISGGGQENNLRSGTENVFGNIVMAKCLQNTMLKWEKYDKMVDYWKNMLLVLLNDHFVNRIKINGAINHRVSNNLNVSFKDIDGETLVVMLIYDGYCVSSGSACHSGSSEVSHVIKELDTPENYQKGTLRITFEPREYTEVEIKELAQAIINKVEFLYKGGDNI